LGSLAFSSLYAKRHTHDKMLTAALAMTKTRAITDPMRHDLEVRGWALSRRLQLDGAMAAEHCLALANGLGTPIATRGRGLVDVLVPRTPKQSRARSLSAQVGTGPQPWHVDLSHCAVPARYLVMCCLRVGQRQVATELLDRQDFLQSRDIGDAASEPFLVRSGPCSFYGTILEGPKRFLRFDPGCMQGATKRAGELMRRLLDQATCPSYVHRWAVGDILIIDNWRLLHRRTDASESSERTLLRVTVMQGE
jgi:hypothetical protein